MNAVWASELPLPEKRRLCGRIATAPVLSEAGSLSPAVRGQHASQEDWLLRGCGHRERATRMRRTSELVGDMRTGQSKSDCVSTEDDLNPLKVQQCAEVLSAMLGVDKFSKTEHSDSHEEHECEALELRVIALEGRLAEIEAKLGPDMAPKLESADCGGDSLLTQAGYTMDAVQEEIFDIFDVGASIGTQTGGVVDVVSHSGEDVQEWPECPNESMKVDDEFEKADDNPDTGPGGGLYITEVTGDLLSEVCDHSTIHRPNNLTMLHAPESGGRLRRKRRVATEKVVSTTHETFRNVTFVLCNGGRQEILRMKGADTVQHAKRQLQNKCGLLMRMQCFEVASAPVLNDLATLDEIGVMDGSTIVVSCRRSSFQNMS